MGLLGACGDDNTESDEPDASAAQTNVVPTSFKVVKNSYDYETASLPIAIEGGYCTGNPEESRTRIDHVKVEESGAKIVVTPYVTQWEGFCRGIGARLHAEVALSEPLGERDVFDGSTNPPRRELTIMSSRPLRIGPQGVALPASAGNAPG